MRSTPNLSVEKYRVRDGRLSSSRHHGNNGAFLLPGLTRPLNTTVSDGEEWEHVSVSLGPTSTETPTWAEMCYVKDLFWGHDECVVQYHPAREDYRNLHHGCLHLWRPTAVKLPRPSPGMVA